jgi:hypothetical protein
MFDFTTYNSLQSTVRYQALAFNTNPTPEQWEKYCQAKADLAQFVKEFRK